MGSKDSWIEGMSWISSWGKRVRSWIPSGFSWMEFLLLLDRVGMERESGLGIDEEKLAVVDWFCPAEPAVAKGGGRRRRREREGLGSGSRGVE